VKHLIHALLLEWCVEEGVANVTKIKKEKRSEDDYFDDWDHIPSGGYDKWE